jgi:alkylation response protein AidB-like acyl-CoA dehydrogenase
MQLALTEDQTLLARTAASFVAEHSPVTRLRKLRDARDERGYALSTYAKLAELGFTAIPFSEADGGVGLGFAELLLVTEALGRGLSPEPFIPSVVLAGRTLARAGSAQQKSAWLAPLIAGEKLLAFAYAGQTSRFDLTRVPFRAQRAGAAYRLSGQATQVWGGHLADAYLVAARSAGEDGQRQGITLFLVPAASARSERQQRVDSLNVARVTLDGVELSDAHVVGAPDQGYELLASAIDEGCVALCGEMLGGMVEAFERTRAYLRERKQFGVPIGSFQALKHRAARLFIELELSRSAVMAAARALDLQLPESAQLVSLAKARVSDAYCLVANEAVQMHAGIGMTDEHDIGLFMKRARACEQTFGDAAYHRERFATLNGY